MVSEGTAAVAAVAVTAAVAAVAVTAAVTAAEAVAVDAARPARRSGCHAPSSAAL